MAEVTLDPKELAKELGPASEAPVGPMVGIASIALNMAMKYHDINHIHDGALYQQYKLEGRNIRPLELEWVFETAMRIEKHLVDANKRVTELIALSFLEDETQPANTEPSPEAAEPNKPD